MSRSRKKPYYKDNGIYNAHEYWSVIRHEWKQKINYTFQGNTPFVLYWETFDVDDFELRDAKVIIDDYDYCDYTFYVDSKSRSWSIWSEEDVEKYSRK
jgi:hypothetical protein